MRMDGRIKLVKVEWLDAVVNSTWQSIHDAAKENAHVCHSIGYLVAEDDKRIVLASTYSEDVDEGGQPDRQCNNVIVIPRAFLRGRIKTLGYVTRSGITIKGG